MEKLNSLNIFDTTSNDLKKKIIKIENEIESLNIEEVSLFASKIADDDRKSVKKLSVRLLKFLNNYNNEKKRVRNLYDFDRKFLKNDTQYLAGVDEVGRGPLAGPIVAASVVLDLNYKYDNNLILYINDSKKLSFDKRKYLSEIIKEKAVSYSIKLCNNNEIDQCGIAWCNNKVFQDCIKALKVKPYIVLSDGYKIKNVNYNNEGIVKGDSKSASIACASIIAKVYRDELMINLSKQYPGYDFDKNVGYGTKKHITAIKKIGICDIHRKSFLTNIMNK